MKTSICIILFLLLFATGASAFKPGPTIIRECPGCHVPVEQDTMASGNTFGARFWSDGKTGAPMLPDYPWLVKCPECDYLFWIDEAKKLGDTEKGWEGQQKVASHKLIIPTQSDFYSVAATVSDERKQKYIRRHLWRCANDPYRNGVPAGRVNFSAQAKANMNALAQLLDEKNPEERFMKAEIARELGQFDRCVELLNFKFDKRLSDTASAVKMLAQGKYAPVMEFTPLYGSPNNHPTASAVPTSIDRRLFVSALKESCVLVVFGLLTRNRIEDLLASDRKRLKAAITAGATKGDGSAVATVLSLAIRNNSADAVHFLLDSGARTDDRSNYPTTTPLITACNYKMENLAKMLINHGANVNATNGYKMTPLAIACIHRNVNLVRLLLDKGADVNGGDASSSLLTEALYYNDSSSASKIDWVRKTQVVTKLLLDHGAKVNGIDPPGGHPKYRIVSTPLIAICSKYFIIEGKSSPYIRTKVEKAACESIYLDIIRLLLDSGADINKCDSEGGSPLFHACQADNMEAVKLLIERGADVNKEDIRGVTPLSVADKLPDKSIAQLLIEHGAKTKAGK